MSISSQQKRNREEEEAFQVYQNRNTARKQRKVAYGSSQVNIDDDGAAAPLEFYVGNTTPRASKEIIEAVMIKCARAIQPEGKLSVLEVQQLATQLVNPRTKSWKVVVAYKHKDLMEMDNMYPPGWTHRKYFGARTAKDNPAKHARKDDIVLAVIDEHQRKKAEEEQLAEEKRLGDEAAK